MLHSHVDQMKMRRRHFSISHTLPRSGATLPWKKVVRRRVFPLERSIKPARVLPLQIAMEMARKMAKENVQGMIDGLRSCLSVMSTGQGHLNHVREFEYATMSAELVERQGVVRGLSGQIADAGEVIKSMRLRADEATGLVGPMLDHELIALETFTEIHRFQLEQLSQGEYEGVLRSLAGRMGGKIQIAVAEVDKRRA